MLFNTVNYNDVRDSHFFIDVRSPSEYDEDTIPGAVNIPILNDEERTAVGTTYKQSGKNEARRLGVNLISPKMPGIFEQVLQLKNEHNQIAAFCARGGYRSTYFSSVFSSIGMPVARLEGGYKGYRRFVIESMPLLNDKVTYIVIHGNTGVGKTDILHSLHNIGYSILDLEGAANHRGSLLGSIGIGKCNSQKNFETNLVNQLINIKSKYVFIEAESHKIGKVVIPKYISKKMELGYHIFVDADIFYRIKSLKKDYILNDNWKAETIDALEFLKKHISKDKIEILRNEISLGNFDYAARELMEKYYDPLYNFQSNKINYDGKFKALTNSDEIAQEIVTWFKKIVD